MAEAYRLSHKNTPEANGTVLGRAASPTSVLYAMLAALKPQISTGGATVLFAILMRVVPLGVKPMAVLNAYNDAGYAAWSPSCDIGYFAKWTYEASLPHAPHVEALQGVGDVKLGIQFRPMRCTTLASPHLLPWLFTKGARTEGLPLRPINGRLVILPEGVWTIPQVPTAHPQIHCCVAAV